MIGGRARELERRIDEIEKQLEIAYKSHPVFNSSGVSALQDEIRVLESWKWQRRRSVLGIKILLAGLTVVLLFALLGGVVLWMRIDPSGAAQSILGETGDTALEIIDLWSGDMIKWALPIGLVWVVIQYFRGRNSKPEH